MSAAALAAAWIAAGLFVAQIAGIGDMEKRKNKLMRRFVWLIEDMVEMGELSIQQAGREMSEAGVPLDVACRVLAGRKA